MTPELELQVLRTKVALLGPWHVCTYKTIDPVRHWYVTDSPAALAKYVHLKGQRAPPGLYFNSEREALEAVISLLTDPDTPYELSR